jgi:hypothetical protein
VCLFRQNAHSTHLMKIEQESHKIKKHLKNNHTKQTMKISLANILASSAALAMCLDGATAAPSRAMKGAMKGTMGTRGGAGAATRATPRPYMFGVDESQSSFSACPGGTIVSRVLTSAGKAIPNKVVTLTIKAGRDTVQKAATTDDRGRVAFDFSLTPEQQRQLAGTDLGCSLTVENPSIRTGRQVLSCPRPIEVCVVPECNDAIEGSVICQGDIWFESLYEAASSGMREEDCVSEDEYVPDCEQIAGPVICQGDMEFDSLCDAVSRGMRFEDCVPEDEYMPDCEQIAGPVICQGDIEFDSLCAAQAQGFSMDTCMFA